VLTLPGVGTVTLRGRVAAMARILAEHRDVLAAEPVGCLELHFGDGEMVRPTLVTKHRLDLLKRARRLR
jgi:hypothetical protein